MVRISRISVALLAGLALLAFSTARDIEAGEGSLMGFSEDAVAAQHELEAHFDEYLDTEDISGWIEKMSARPHHVGSPYSKEVAEFIAAQLSSWGWDAGVETYWVLFPTPKVRMVEMLEPQPFTASLTEPELDEDSTSGQTDEQLPIYNAYSIDGDVTGELVFVNYGIPSDY